MRVVVQRTSRASVSVNDETISEISQGLVLLIGFGEEDQRQTLKLTAKKIANLRIFSDENGRFSSSVLDVSGSVLAVPQFTLYADCRKGRRPEFFRALQPKAAELYFEQFVEDLKAEGISTVAKGVFGANMEVKLLNQGPVTIVIDSEELFGKKRSVRD